MYNSNKLSSLLKKSGKTIKVITSLTDSLKEVNEKLNSLFDSNTAKINKLADDNSEIMKEVDKNENFITNLNNLFKKQT